MSGEKLKDQQSLYYVDPNSYQSVEKKRMLREKEYLDMVEKAKENGHSIILNGTKYDSISSASKKEGISATRLAKLIKELRKSSFSELERTVKVDKHFTIRIDKNE